MNAPFDPVNFNDDGQVLDITTPGGRARLFKKRIDELTKPKTQGGPGLTTDQAIRHMRANQTDAALLAAMGA